jgi:hypothetical protein
MMYKTGTLEEYLIENPQPSDEESSQKKKWKNPKKDNEYLWESETGTIEKEDKFDLVSVWNNSIIKPSSTRYFINKNGKYTAGLVEAGSVMESALKNLEIFRDKQQWLQRVEDSGAIIEEELL